MARRKAKRTGRKSGWASHVKEKPLTVPAKGFGSIGDDIGHGFKGGFAGKANTNKQLKRFAS